MSTTAPEPRPDLVPPDDGSLAVTVRQAERDYWRGGFRNFTSLPGYVLAHVTWDADGNAPQEPS